ncbi:MAG: hypothetical protein EOP54_00375 [Sphingobacteriales bacterium]|nr:MAG: hypothetical protein EOP54_00375 [Sphingobacteriales bacterium]
MKIENQHNMSIDELLDHLKSRYPAAEIKKPFLSSRSIIIPVNNMKHVIRPKNTYFNTDFVLPVGVAILALLGSVVLFTVVISLIFGQFVPSIGGGLWIVLALFATKAIYKSVKKEDFNLFYEDVRAAVNTTKSDSSIF